MCLVGCRELDTSVICCVDGEIWRFDRSVVRVVCASGVMRSFRLCCLVVISAAYRTPALWKDTFRRPHLTVAL